MKNILHTIKELLALDIAAIDNIETESVACEVNLLRNITGHIGRMSGKRIRILLMLLITKLLNGSIDQEQHKIAASIEFIHNATLLHDDVIDDNSMMRRGITVANKLWTNKACVLAGDFLLSKAFSLITEVDIKQISQILANASSVVVSGEINQIIYNEISDLSQYKYDDYINVIREKTAILFASSCEIGAIFANANIDIQKSFNEFGMNVGVAFQIIDDLLDYIGDAQTLGKEPGIDFHEGKVTLPIILLYSTLSSKYTPEMWLDLWPLQNAKRTDMHFTRIKKMIEHYNIKEVIYADIDKYIKIAKSQLDNFKGEYKDLLIDLIEFVTNRSV